MGVQPGNFDLHRSGTSMGKLSNRLLRTHQPCFFEEVAESRMKNEILQLLKVAATRWFCACFRLPFITQRNDEQPCESP